MVLFVYINNILMKIPYIEKLYYSPVKSLSFCNTSRLFISKDIGILHEINDQMDIIKPITKWQARVLKAKKIPNVVKKSFDISEKVFLLDKNSSEYP